VGGHSSARAALPHVREHGEARAGRRTHPRPGALGRPSGRDGRRAVRRARHDEPDEGRNRPVAA
jgi:hypothetical protein